MFFQKAFIGKNKWYLYLVVLVLVFIATQLGSIPFVIYNVLANPEALAANDTEALSAVQDN